MTNRVREILTELSPGLFHEFTADQVTRKFTEVAHRIGLEGLKLHSLTHTLETFMIALGVDIVVVKELLGHEDIKTTMIYAKADLQLLRQAVKKFGELASSCYRMVTKGEDQNETPRAALLPGASK